MLKRFQEYIKQYQLILPEQRILAAASGGLDSMVMTDLLYKSKINFAIAHCNFQLRAEESDADEQFVGQLATNLQVSFYNTRFSTLSFAEKNKISIQMAARELRYSWFEELAKVHEYERIATAHHKNDLAETILLNITRGTGIAGLKGIIPLSNNIIRPLLFAERQELESYALENNIKWREDSSNASTKYHRNLIRKEVIPVLKKLNPSFEETLSISAEKIAAVQNIFQQYMEEAKRKCFREENEMIFINLKILLSLKEPQLLLSEFIKPYQFSYLEAGSILATETLSGKRLESQNYILVRNRDELILSKKHHSISPISIPKETTTIMGDYFKINLSEIDNHELQFPNSQESALLNLDKLKFPLTLRPWTEGDYFYPLGMQQKKKISDFLIDNKIPLNLKSRILVLCSEGEIVWVVGHRIDDRYKITTQTKKVLHLHTQTIHSIIN